MDAIVRCGSLDEYIIKTNSFFLIILGVIHYTIDYYNLTILRTVLEFFPIWILKWGLIFYFIHNIWTSYERQSNSQQKQKDHGPLTKMLIRCSIAIYTSIQSLATGKKTTMNPATTTKPSAVTPPSQLASTLTPTTNTIKRFEPNFQSSSLEKSSSLTTAAADSSPFVNKLIPSTEQLSKEGYAKSSLKRMLEESDRIASTTKQQTRFATSLSFSPSIPPPRPPVKRLDKSLWSLYRTEKMVEDFRDEQLELFNENWSKFNDRASKCYYDQLNTWLSGKIFHPLAATIDKINQQIKDSNYSLADCPLDAMVMLMFQFDHSMFGLPIRLIHDALQIPGYDSIKARQYIIDRIKDLATGNKMAAYRYTPRQDDLPSDALILLHCFKTYLIHELPSVVPPLVPGEGDIFKFLLVYFYITDDLRDEIFELPIHK